MFTLRFTGCVDSDELAAQNQLVLEIRYELAESLGHSALEAIEQGKYLGDHGLVDWSAEIRAAEAAKVSLPPNSSLPKVASKSLPETQVVVINQTTLKAARELTERGDRPLALNFANGVEPGGGFLRGATAQEETLCRSSALYTTLVADPMYAFHRSNDPAASSDWAILSPNVPVFRDDAGMELDQPWRLSFLTCAAPYAPTIGRRDAEPMLRNRIHRVLSIAQAYEYESLVLGAWGCGVFANDPRQTALDFRAALEGEFAGTFGQVVFAIADWSDNRRFLRPFCEVFSSSRESSSG
ncbi:TIGR02452 family protein [Roseimaritima sediminicola]|uniref:TIGR02452 family protein n=1 Tax=Roseimaritima sediminicola TaxID=2662066 RepID=UPI00129856AF|nr:TIGR02452 family protein [Roseimaritima sediminicola]